MDSTSLVGNFMTVNSVSCSLTFLLKQNEWLDIYLNLKVMTTMVKAIMAIRIRIVTLANVQKLTCSLSMYFS